MKDNRNAFSLIELMVVLIIFSLIVAGITAGTSLIKSSNLRAFMSEIRNYQTAINTYYNATGELPGSGGSQQIDFINSCQAWGDMMKEGVVDISIKDVDIDDVPTCTELTGDNSAFTTTNSPSGRLKDTLFAIGYNKSMKNNVIFATAVGEKPISLTLAIAPSESTVYKSNATLKKSVLTRRDAKSIDNKMDNGIIDTGRVQSFSAGSGTPTCKYNNTGIKDSDLIKDCATAISIDL